jgi:hypothetical protein
MDSVSAVVSEIIAQGSFDATSAEVLAVLNRRHKTMVARARTFKKAMSAGSTVANQQVYANPAGLIEAREVTVAGVTYGRGNHTDLSAGSQDMLTLDGAGGIFVATADSAGVDSFALYPVPTTSGDAIVVYGSYRPSDLLIDNSVPFRIDDEDVEGLMAGVFATLLARPGEARPDLAVAQEQIFGAACEEARLREAKRLRGPGPSIIRVAGINA